MEEDQSHCSFYFETLPSEISFLFVQKYLPDEIYFLISRIPFLSKFVTQDQVEKSRLEICSFAARNGFLSLLQWSRSQDCPWNAFACENAAEKGHLEVLKWLRSQGCPWNALTCAYAA